MIIVLPPSMGRNRFGELGNRAPALLPGLTQVHPQTDGQAIWTNNPEPVPGACGCGPPGGLEVRGEFEAAWWLFPVLPPVVVAVLEDVEEARDGDALLGHGVAVADGDRVVVEGVEVDGYAVGACLSRPAGGSGGRCSGRRRTGRVRRLRLSGARCRRHSRAVGVRRSLRLSGQDGGP